MKRSIYELVKDQVFFKGLDDHYIQTIAACGSNVHFQSNDYIAREGQSADNFYLIRSGLVGVETHVPNRGAVLLQTLTKDEIAGWSWIFPPYRWVFDLKALDEVSAIALDGACLRKKCEANPSMGYELMKRFARVMSERIRATRLQILDVYGELPRKHTQKSQ